MNIASALIKQILILQDFETWSVLHERYLPTEYHALYRIINSHCEKFHKIPTFEDLKYEIRDQNTKEKLYAIESVEVSADSYLLLQYLKNEYTQKEILLALEKYVDNSIAFEDAEEAINHLHQIILDVEAKVDLDDSSETMQRISLFEKEEELEKYLSLGLNDEFDQEIKFSPRDLILIGGKRGGGKSIVCANLANNTFEKGKTTIMFTIEMDARQNMQRICAIGTGVSASKIQHRNLSILEWEKIVQWWGLRFEDSDSFVNDYLNHRDFDKFHQELTSKRPLIKSRQIDIIYDPHLTITKIKAEIDKRMKSDLNVGLIIVDYLNQVKRSAIPIQRVGQYDWTEQIEISKALKRMAQDYEVPIVSPYQIDATGQARFSKGILDAPDAAFSINAWEKEDACISFRCEKMRSNAMLSFSSYIDWTSLKIGPNTALTPDEKEQEESTGSTKTGENINDVPF